MVTSNKSKPVSKFHDLVYKVCKEIPKGKVATYQELAQKIGSPKAVRAVGNALRNNPFAPVVIRHINFHFKLYV
jgi:O-6-methylguanine DNA methyltransferase